MVGSHEKKLKRSKSNKIIEIEFKNQCNDLLEVLITVASATSNPRDASATTGQRTEDDDDDYFSTFLENKKTLRTRIVHTFGHFQKM